MFIIRRVGEMARQGAIGVEDLIRNKVNKIRHWKLTSLGKKRPKWGFEFTVMTYNILSQAAMDCHIYLYLKANPQYISEEYRISRIIPEILRSRSDVVCLQEVEQHLYHQKIKQVFDSNGFGSVFKKRTGAKSDGCAILWRRAKFSLLGHHEVEYKTKGCELLKRDNVGLIAVLRPRHPQASQMQLHVATTHLIYNPRRGDVKLCQLRFFLAELERLAFREVGEHGRVYHPTILLGDFNFEPHSPLYRFVENGRLDVSGLVSGNMSGQHGGKDKGGMMERGNLSLDGVGIDESGRFGSGGNPSSRSQEACGGLGKSQRDSTFDSGGNNKRKAECSSSSRLESYRMLKDMVHATQLQCEDSSHADERGLSPSTSSSDSDGTSQFFYHDFNFVPAYKYYSQDKKSRPITSMTGNDCNTVDHVFYNVREKSSTSFVEDRLRLLGTYSLPHVEDLKDIGGLPNAHLGSDHLSLMSKFLISFKH